MLCLDWLHRDFPGILQVGLLVDSSADIKQGERYFLQLFYILCLSQSDFLLNYLLIISLSNRIYVSVVESQFLGDRRNPNNRYRIFFGTIVELVENSIIILLTLTKFH